MRISFSRAQTKEACGRQYKYRYVDRLTSVLRPFALAFGSAVDKAISGYVYRHALGQCFETVSCFEEAWAKEISENQVQYPQHWDAAVAREVGVTMCEKFPEVWDRSNLVAVVDSNGVPIVQRRIIAPLPKNHEVEMILDVMVTSLDSGETAVLDFKTASQVMSPESPFGHNSLQLSTYQYGADYEFGDWTGPVSNVGFMEFIKRKPPKKSGMGPTIEDPLMFPRRGPDSIREMQQIFVAHADSINKGEFFRHSKGAYNSPCDMCDFARLCTRNDRQGIIERPARRAA